MKEWFNSNLGLQTDAYGTNFEWRQTENSDKKGFTQWSPFNMESKYMEPSKKEFMINYQVDDIVKLVDELRSSGVGILDKIEEFEYSKFVPLLDPKGNKIELWEPNDVDYDKIVARRTF